MRGPVTEIRGGYLEVQGVRLAYDEAGEGPPLLCLHTAGMSSLEWRFALPFFAAHGYRAVAPDLPGHGKSLLRDWRPIEAVHDFAEVIRAFAQALGLERPVAIGCSLGGDIVLDLAAHHATGLRAAVCCGAGAQTRTFLPAFLERGREDAGIPSFHELNFYRGEASSGRGALPERVREIQWLRRRSDPKITIADLTAWNAQDLRGRLRAVTCPVLLIWGEDDIACPREAVERTRAELPDAELVVLPGIGHFPMMESLEFNDLVLDFLKRKGI